MDFRVSVWISYKGLWLSSVVTLYITIKTKMIWFRKLRTAIEFLHKATIKNFAGNVFEEGFDTMANRLILPWNKESSIFFEIIKNTHHGEIIPPTTRFSDFRHYEWVQYQRDTHNEPFTSTLWSFGSCLRTIVYFVKLSCLMVRVWEENHLFYQINYEWSFSATIKALKPWKLWKLGLRNYN